MRFSHHRFEKFGGGVASGQCFSGEMRERAGGEKTRPVKNTLGQASQAGRARGGLVRFFQQHYESVQKETSRFACLQKPRVSVDQGFRVSVETLGFCRLANLDVSFQTDQTLARVVSGSLQVLNLRTTSSQKCEAVPRRARIQGA